MQRIVLVVVAVLVALSPLAPADAHPQGCTVMAPNLMECSYRSDARGPVLAAGWGQWYVTVTHAGKTATALESQSGPQAGVFSVEKGDLIALYAVSEDALAQVYGPPHLL